ncbi:alkaline phosphatase synthesis sensor protein PhoR [Clostridium acetobutylicum]|nr:alkaline phosphatase synthesis sensor protein PhoR [Clostridium acetobutylicum]OOM04195.1 alkaline phosphatase synthesis sensor protein PhoR [Clostridium acetobutylicum]
MVIKVKKKLVLYNLGILIITLIMITVLFIKIEDYEYRQNTEQDLKRTNNVVSNVIDMNKGKDISSALKVVIKNSDIRVTYINKNGVVLYDNDINAEKLDNHNKRVEVAEARKNGYGYSVRYSKSLKNNIIYYAKVRGDGTVVRTAVELSSVERFEARYLKFYIYVIALSIIAAVYLSFKLSYVILNPIRELQNTSSRIAMGELETRVNVESRDEIGQLGKTFNNMAGRLQSTIRESVEKQKKLEAILVSMDSGVIAVDRKHKIIMINPYAEKIFGIDKNIIGQSLMDCIRNYEFEDIFNKRAEGYAEIKTSWPKERNLRIKTADIINGYECIGTVAVVQDITDIRKLENMRTQFVANVSHELKTPLTSIKGFAETLRYVEDDNQKGEFLDIIDDEVDRLTRLISDILTLSDIEIRPFMKKEEFDVNEIIKAVCGLLEKSASRKNISLKVFGEDVPNLIGDNDKFKQMIINLVDNAIKYTEAGGEVSVYKKYTKDDVIISVKDNGVGIPKEHLQRIFERFYRVDKARSRANGGTGLGLAIVKHIVLNFNGSINIESKLGVGTEFIITIPYK